MLVGTRYSRIGIRRPQWCDSQKFGKLDILRDPGRADQADQIPSYIIHFYPNDINIVVIVVLLSPLVTVIVIVNDGVVVNDAIVNVVVNDAVVNAVVIVDVVIAVGIVIVGIVGIVAFVSMVEGLLG